MRRLLTFLVTALITAATTSAWLYDGDLVAAVSPVLPEWNAAALAEREGIGAPPTRAEAAVPGVNGDKGDNGEKRDEGDNGGKGEKGTSDQKGAKGE
jgi:hypothetical protein